MKKITASILSVLMMLSMVFSSSVFAANEQPSAWESFVGLFSTQATAATTGVEYRGHIENIGNYPTDPTQWVQGPTQLGTVGRSLRLEGFWIQLTNKPANVNIQYRVHVQNEGWMAPVQNGKFAGTEGKSQRIEAIEISLVDDKGAKVTGYSVMYKGHIQYQGDTAWLADGAQLGTTGLNRRLEALEVKIVKTQANMTAYDAAVLQAKAAKEADYTTTSFAALTKALADNVVTADNTQVEVDAATTAITTAFKALVAGADLTAYDAIVKKANDADKDLFTTASYAALTKALADNVVTKDNTAAEVTAATTAITTAFDGLTLVANMEAYDAAVLKAKAAKEADYTAATFAALTKALADNVVTAQDTQAKVDAAVVAIDAAYDALVKVWKIDTVKGVTNTVVDVTLTEAAAVADINAVVIKNAAGTVVKINDAVLSADGKLITLYTDAQETGKSYSLTSGTMTKTYVAGVADVTAPTQVTAVSKSNTVVEVTFTDVNRLEVASATNVANYTIPGLTVTGATISTDAATNGKVVVLTTSAQTAGTVYTVSVLNVADIARNAIKTALTSSFAGKAADKDAISAVTPSSYSNTQVLVLFTDASNVDPTTATTLANYTIAGLTPTAAKFIATADDAATYGLNAATYVNKAVVLTTPAQTAGTVYTLSVNGVADVVGNVMTVAKSATFAGKAADKTAPTLTSAAPYNNTKVVVNFNDTANLDPTSAANVANYTIAGLTPTAAQLITTTTDAATYAGSTVYKSVVLTTPAQTAGTVYTLSVLGVADVNGNAITTAKTTTFAGKGVDTVKPTIVSTTAKAGNLVDVVFSKSLDKASAETLTNYSISTLGYPVSATYNSTTKTVTLATAVQTSGTIYTMTVNGVTDTSGNVIVTDTQKTFAGIGTAQDAPALSSVTALDNSRIKVVFNKAVTGGSGPLAIGDFTLYKGTTDTTLSSNVDVVLKSTNTAGTEYIIYVGTAAGDKLTADVYTLKVKDTVKDLGGNVIGSTDATKYQKTFGGIVTDPTAPAITSLTQTGVKTVVATFNQDMDTQNLGAAGDVFVSYDASTTIDAASTAKAVVDTNDKTKVTFTFASNIAADKVAKLNIKNAGLSKFTDITGKVIMTANNTTTNNYEVQFGTLSFGTDTLTLTSATGVDDMTLELAFSEDITFNGGNPLSSITSANFMTITKLDATAVSSTFTYAEQTASNKVRVYFSHGTMEEGTVYKAIITNGAEGTTLFKKATDGTAITAANAIQTFGYNATVNEGPKLLSVVPLSGTVAQLTFSEPLSADPTQANNLTFKNGANTFAASSVGLADVYGTKTVYTATLTNGVFLAGTTYTVEVVSDTLKDKYGIKPLVATNGTTVPHLTFGGGGDLATTLALPVAGATNRAADLLMTFGTKLYAPSAGTMTELTAADHQAKFTLTGVTATSGTYASAKTVTWAVIADASIGDTIAVKADSIYDAAGNSLTPANFTVVYNGTSWDKQ